MDQSDGVTFRGRALKGAGRRPNVTVSEGKQKWLAYEIHFQHAREKARYPTAHSLTTSRVRGIQQPESEAYPLNGGGGGG